MYDWSKCFQQAETSGKARYLRLNFFVRTVLDISPTFFTTVCIPDTHTAPKDNIMDATTLSFFNSQK